VVKSKSIKIHPKVTYFFIIYLDLNQMNDSPSAVTVSRISEMIIHHLLQICLIFYLFNILIDYHYHVDSNT